MERCQEKKKKIRSKVIAPVGIFAAYAVLDYFNIPGSMGMKSERINMDFFGIFLDAVIVIVLYIVTYYFVDHRQIQKDTNSRDTADTLLLYTYKDCQDYLSIIYDPEWVKQYIVPKIDGNKPAGENKVIMEIQNSPFGSQNEVLELAKNGYIDKAVLAKYLQIQKEYQHMVRVKIIFFDLGESQSEMQEVMTSKINARKIALDSLLEEEINRLEEVR